MLDEVTGIAGKVSEGEVHNVLRSIVNNAHEKSLNYAVNYARYGLEIGDPHELRVQCLYVLNNMTRWRGEEAKRVRATLKEYCG